MVVGDGYFQSREDGLVIMYLYVSFKCKINGGGCIRLL